MTDTPSPSGDQPSDPWSGEVPPDEGRSPAADPGSPAAAWGPAGRPWTRDDPAAPPQAPAWPPGSSWPPGWAGAPWPGPPHPRRSRRPVMVAGGAMLVVGLAVGAAVTSMAVRGEDNGGPPATILINSDAMQASGGDAVKVAEELGPAVGTIIARGSSQSALGSGFVVAHSATRSYLLTNNHVVTGSTDLHVVMPDGKHLAATIVGTDALDDLAVLAVPDSSLKVATFGPSSALKVGQPVVAIGSPLGNEGSVTQGVISALHRTIDAGSDGGTSTEVLQDVLQTDASINHGNSGGPLADVYGRVIGVNVAIAGNGATNIGYSIPSDLADRVVQELIDGDRVQHPFLGIGYLTSIEAIEAGQAFDGAGVLVKSVSAGSPAAQAGFRAGDILQAVDGTLIENGETLGGLIQGHRVGDRVTLTVKRAGKLLTLTATLVDRPAGAG